MGNGRSFLLARVVALLCSLTACSTADLQTNLSPAVDSGTEQSVFNTRHVDLIVTDLVGAMVQVFELSPLSTTLQVAEPRSTFGKNLLSALEQAGYGIQWVSADQGDNYLSYEIRSIQSVNRDVRDFSLRVGQIELRREYDVAKGKVYPASIMYISGTALDTDIFLNEAIFLQQGGQFSFGSGVELALSDETVIPGSEKKIEQSAGVLARRVDRGELIQIARNHNLNRISAELLRRRDEFRSLRGVTFEFEDDSLILGRENKAVIQLLLSEYDNRNDALFVSACAFGDETQEHADEHVTRLKDEFILNGVPSARVVEEGCAPDQHPEGQELTKHSVVVVQRRVIGDSELAGMPRTPDTFPNRPLELTIANSSGGATDFQARLVTMMSAQTDVLGQSIMTVNKPGDGGRAGWTWFAETAQDSGYDIASYSIPDMIAQSIRFATQYNIDTLEPIVNWGADPAVLIVPASSPFDTLRDFILYAKANPGELTVSGGGIYVGHHIALLQLQQAADISLSYQPDDNAAVALEKVSDAVVMAGFNDMSEAFRHSDEIRILAIADLQRNPVVPLVPTFLESGVSIDDSSVNFRGLMVPKGTPESVIEHLSEAAVRMVSHPVVVKRMEEAGAPLKIMDRKESMSFWKTRQALLTSLLKNL